VWRFVRSVAGSRAGRDSTSLREWEVVGRNDLTLHDDGEVDLHLIEPGPRGRAGWISRRVGQRVFEPVDGGLAAVGGGRCRPPRNTRRGRGVGLAGPSPGRPSRWNGSMPVVSSQRPNTLARVARPRRPGRPARRRGRIRARRASPGRGAGGVVACFADAGLDGGLLVGGDHELVAPQRGVRPKRRA